jgi:hypothetical protein
MKRLFIATIILFLVVGGTVWVLSTDPKIDPQALNNMKWVSKYKTTLPKAEAGNAEAQFDVAYMLEHGDGVDRNMTAAVNWYMKAAAQGLSKAQYQVGWMYEKGIGLRQNYAEAAKWYRIAATFNNNTEAQYRLGDMHFYGRGVEQDYAKSIKYYTQAASKGNPAAQYLLGSMYGEGWGVTRDLIVAYMWTKMAVPNRAAAMAVNKEFDPVKKLKQLKVKMNNFQIEEAEKRLAILAQRMPTSPVLNK